MTKEEAIRRIKAWNLDSDDMEVLSVVVPELAESEDERIRKDLVNLIGWLKANPKLCYQYYNDRYDKMLAYLEKQKKQPIPEVFRTLRTEYEKGVADTIAKYEQKEQKPVSGSSEKPNNHKEWSEEDDMLMDELESYILYDKEFNDEQKTWRIKRLKSLRPQKLDASKLENFDPVEVLNKIKTEWPMAWEKVVGKQEWSKEDENAITIAIRACRYMTENYENSTKQYEDAIERLKSLHPYPNAEWSKEDKEIAKSLAFYLETDKGNFSCNGFTKDEFINFLKSFHQQPKAEWSDEDETCLEYALWCVMKTRHFVAKDACDLDACRCAERWLEFLPERFSPQPKVKWSKEDIEIIDKICSNLEYLIQTVGCDSVSKEKLVERIKWMRRLKSLSK